jgi:hypothetical protein
MRSNLVLLELGTAASSAQLQEILNRTSDLTEIDLVYFNPVPQFCYSSLI